MPFLRGRRATMSGPNSHSLPCPICGHFKLRPLIGEAAVARHLRDVHWIGGSRLASREENLALASRIAARLAGGESLEVASRGPCADCGRLAETVHYGQLELCGRCARRRQAARAAGP